MVNNNAIGIFDSGVGGLTVMAEIMRLLPSEDIIYFGDTAHVPYGSKSPEVVSEFSQNIASYLVSKKVKIIVIACNTASAFALGALRKKFKIPIIGVIEPGSKSAVKSTKNCRIGVIGTEGTIKSSSYSRAISRLRSNSSVFLKACPLFVPLVEEGWICHPITEQVAREYLNPLLENRIDTLVLGCTHYPLIKDTIQKVVGEGISLIDSASATAEEVASVLTQRGLAANNKRRAKYRFFVSDSPDKFRHTGELFLKYPITHVKKVSLDDCRK